MPPTVIICGSATPVGMALADALVRAGNTLITIDQPGDAGYPDAVLALSAAYHQQAAWPVLIDAIKAGGWQPSMVAIVGQAAEPPQTLAALSQLEWDRVLNQNLRAAYLACQQLLPLMRSPGAIVLLGSVLAGWDTRADMAALSASSGGLLALTQSLALTAAAQDIRVNCVCIPAALPANPDARQELLGRIPLGRATSPADLVEPIMFLLSEDARHITGTSLVVDGGQSLQSWSNASDTPYPVG